MLPATPTSKARRCRWLPLIANVQGAERTARVGCLVTDGHTNYALTKRHVGGDRASPMAARRLHCRHRAQSL
ncbi:hypothetical protein AWB66_04909 [Caballeronia telluris]|uniref:Uncharacterized protein n=1 Tax=Caballeronia telluris TaxID=326475 RepID=A0A158JY53_9BURK|nr:hypothetical protein AWB66_04909 [Caballeronia telluris]